MDAVVYIHGKGGSAAESAHYKPLFPGRAVFGLEYAGSTPWEAGRELNEGFARLKTQYGRLTLIANSIGAYFCMCAGIAPLIEQAYFISPVVDMQKLILGMMSLEGVTEERLREAGEIRTAAGETLSWEYLSYVRAHPVGWSAPAAVLYGANDPLTDLQTVTAFASSIGAPLTVMENGGHWFHTPEEMRFLDAWIAASRA